MKKDVFGYLRVSGKGQLAGDGFPRQRSAINAYANSHGFTVVKWFEERGVCGASDLDNRPALQDLLEALPCHDVQIVLIEKLDRLARDLMVQESILADFKRKGFEVCSALEPDLCSDDPTRVLMRQMLGAFAEYERKCIVAKLRSARKRVKEKQGHCEGRKRFAQHPNRPEEQNTLERMRMLHIAGNNYTSIVRTLNAEGFRTRIGTEFVPATVRRILLREGVLINE